MADEPPAGIVGQVARLSDRLVSTLPPAFLLLVLLNLMFLALVMWFLNSQANQRTAMVEKLVDNCMQIALHANPPK